MNNLLYKENDSLKTFSSIDFNYVFDKKSKIWYSWGKFEDDDVEFDPIGPEIIKIYVNENYVFDENTILKLLNTNLKTEKIELKEGCFLSTISYAQIKINYDLFGNKEIIKLVNYLNSHNIQTSFVIDYDKSMSFKDTVKLKLSGISLITLMIDDFDDNLFSNINSLLSKNIDVNCVFIVNKINARNILSAISNIHLIMKAGFILDDVDDDIEDNIINEIKKNNLINCYILNTLKSVGTKHKISYEEYNDTLFSIVYDFTTNTIYPDESKIKKIKIDDINNITDFWMSNSFKRFRKTLLKNVF